MFYIQLGSITKDFKMIPRQGYTNITTTRVLVLIIGIVLGLTIHSVFNKNEDYQTRVRLPTEIKNCSVAEQLEKEIRILCYVLVGPKSPERDASFIKHTWGRRCTILLFMASYYDADLPTVHLPSPEGGDYLWNKTKETFKYIYDKYEGKYDWIFKADTDTYVIMENLRFLLKQYDPHRLSYLGATYYLIGSPNESVLATFMIGGAGYVLSREAFRLIVKEGIYGNRCMDIQENAGEDWATGDCATRLGIKYENVKDHLDQQRFFQDPPQVQLLPEGVSLTSPLKFDRCSNTTISFHHDLKPPEMVMLEYFVYHIHPYGITYGHN